MLAAQEPPAVSDQPSSAASLLTASFEALDELMAEYADLERQLADPAVHADQSIARRLGRRYAELGPIVATYRVWLYTNDDLAAARELAEEEPRWPPGAASWRSGWPSCCCPATPTTART
jgi:PCRF domain